MCATFTRTCGSTSGSGIGSIIIANISSFVTAVDEFIGGVCVDQQYKISNL